MRSSFLLCTHLASHCWYLKCLRGGKEASPKQLNISLTSYQKMTNPGQFKDHLNWSFKSKIFAHTVRIPFPSYVREMGKIHNPLAVSKWRRGTGARAAMGSGCKIAREVQIQRVFTFNLYSFIWKKKLYKPDQKFVDTNRSLRNTDSCQVYVQLWYQFFHVSILNSISFISWNSFPSPNPPQPLFDSAAPTGTLLRQAWHQIIFQALPLKNATQAPNIADVDSWKHKQPSKESRNMVCLKWNTEAAESCGAWHCASGWM